MFKRSGRSYGNTSRTIADDRKRPGRSLTIGAIVKNQKRSNGNTLRRSGRSGRSKSIPESIIPVTIFRAFARRLPWSSRIFTKMAATSELNSSLFMEEVQKYECLYNKFSKDYKNKFTRLNCLRGTLLPLLRRKIERISK